MFFSTELTNVFKLHVPGRNLKTKGREELIGKVCAVIEDPPVTLELCSGYLGEISEYLSCRRSGVISSSLTYAKLHKSHDGKGYKANKEVCFYVVRTAEIDRACGKVGFGNAEGLLYPPEPSVGIYYLKVFHICF